MSLGSVAFITVILINLGIIPGPIFVQNFDFSGRIHLWRATFYAYLERPIFGWGVGNHVDAMNPYIIYEEFKGFGPHNSYARIFLETGVFGGLSYAFVILVSIKHRLISITSELHLLEFTILFCVLGIHFFEGYTMLGLSLISCVSAIIVGYNVFPSHDRPRR
jgi:O-antigen ligase